MATVLSTMYLRVHHAMYHLKNTALVYYDISQLMAHVLYSALKSQLLTDTILYAALCLTMLQVIMFITVLCALFSFYGIYGFMTEDTAAQ